MPEGTIELWLVRHGETQWSLTGRHTSWTDLPLTEHGQQRALELRDFLAGKKFVSVFVSPRQRARETCDIAGYRNIAVVDDDLQEWNYGESEGKTTAQMREIHGPSWSVWTDPIIGGESLEQVGERADAMIAKSFAASPSGGAVALFAHAHILRILAARWIGLPASGGKLFGLGTGSVSILGYERETQVISNWNRSFENN